MENVGTEVVEVVETGVVAVANNKCIIGKIVLISALVGGVIFIGIRKIKKMKAKKVAANEQQNDDHE